MHSDLITLSLNMFALTVSQLESREIRRLFKAVPDAIIAIRRHYARLLLGDLGVDDRLA